jgi:taurine dioxygenase
MRLTPTNDTLGVNIEDIDLSQPLGRVEFGQILRALGDYGVLCFPRQTLDPMQLKAFSQHFGGLQASLTGTYCEPGMPEVMILSNIVENGQPLGLADAGQDWHTDMSWLCRDLRARLVCCRLRGLFGDERAAALGPRSRISGSWNGASAR